MDNEAEFKNDTWREVLHRLNMEHKFTMVYFPRQNSRLENSHTLLKRCMSKVYLLHQIKHSHRTKHLFCGC